MFVERIFTKRTLMFSNVLPTSLGTVLLTGLTPLGTPECWDLGGGRNNYVEESYPTSWVKITDSGGLKESIEYFL